MSKHIDIRAGKKARALICDKGFQADRVQVVAGAAGGPKWLVLYALDRFLFGDLFEGRDTPLYLIGSSIGAWRFSAASTADPVAAIDSFKEAYINQTYADRKPSPQAVTDEARRIMACFLSDDKIAQVLAHPYFRINMVAARSRLASLRKASPPRQMAALGGMALLNAVSRKSLNLFFERVIFHHPADGHFFKDLPDFPVNSVPLQPGNFKEAVLASGAIPLVMAGIYDIPGAPRGVYLDGGVIDYHMNIDYPCDDDHLVLFPHYAGHIIPGWFDKKVAWRSANPAYLDHVVMVSPSAEFVENLPYAKIPDRDDFVTFDGQDAERMRYWREVCDRSRMMADEFAELIASGKIGEQVKAF